MAYSAHESRARNVPVKISSGAAVTELEVDQTLPMRAGEVFRKIGAAVLEAESETVLRISDADTQGFVILDALRLVREE